MDGAIWTDEQVQNVPLLSTSPHLPEDGQTEHSTAPCLVPGRGGGGWRRQCGGWAGRRDWRAGRATNAIMTQVEAALN